MYKIEIKDYGYKLTFADFIKAEEMQDWVKESEKALSKASKEFGVVIDMRALKPLPQDSKEHMQTGQTLFKRKGMVRSAVILDSAITTGQFKRIAKETGIYEWERYLDASKVADHEKIAVDWVQKGIDPDK